MYETSDEKFDEIVESLGVKKEVLQQEAEKMQEWMKTQLHLPEILELRVIKNFLVQNKFSTEVTKQKIDNYFTLRPHFQFFSNNNPNLAHMKELSKFMFLAGHPELYHNFRLIFFKLRDVSLASKLDPANVVKYMVNVNEILIRQDITLGQVFIVDIAMLPVSYYLKITPRILYEAFTLYESIFSSRLKGIYLMNWHPLVEKILSVAKSIMNPKLFERIHIVKNLEELQNIFPFEYLPIEYGGTSESLVKFQDEIDKLIESHQDLFDHIEGFKVDESLRPEKLNNDEVLGFYGNFKKFEID